MNKNYFSILPLTKITSSLFILLCGFFLFTGCTTAKLDSFSERYHNTYSNNSVSLANDKERFFDMLTYALWELNKSDKTLNFDPKYHEEIDLSLTSDVRFLGFDGRSVGSKQERNDVMQAAAKNLSFCNAAQIITALIYNNVISLENNCTPLSSLTDEFYELTKDEQDFILTTAIFAYNRSAEMLCRTFKPEYYEYPNKKNRDLAPPFSKSTRASSFAKYIKDNAEYKSTERYAKWDPHTYLPFAIVQMYHSKTYREGKNESLYFDTTNSRFTRILRDSRKTRWKNRINEDVIAEHSNRIMDWTKKKIYYEDEWFSSVNFSTWERTEHYELIKYKEKPILVLNKDDHMSGNKDFYAPGSNEDFYHRENTDYRLNTKLRRVPYYNDIDQDIRLINYLEELNKYNSFISNVFENRWQLITRESKFHNYVNSARYRQRLDIRLYNYERLWAETSMLAANFLATHNVKQSLKNTDHLEAPQKAGEIFDKYFKHSIRFANYYGNWELDLCENRLPSDAMLASLVFKQFYTTLPDEEHIEKMDVLYKYFDDNWENQVAFYNNRIKRSAMDSGFEYAEKLQGEFNYAMAQRRYEDQKFREEQRQADFNTAINNLNYIYEHNRQRNAQIAANNRNSNISTPVRANENRSTQLGTGRNTNAASTTTTGNTNVASPSTQSNTENTTTPCNEKQFTLPTQLRSRVVNPTGSSITHPDEPWQYRYLRTENDDNCGNSTLVFEITINNHPVHREGTEWKAWSENMFINTYIPAFQKQLGTKYISTQLMSEWHAPMLDDLEVARYTFKPSFDYDLIEMNLEEWEGNNTSNISDRFYVRDLKMIGRVDVEWIGR